jgi:hypothetical protein
MANQKIGSGPPPPGPSTIQHRGTSNTAIVAGSHSAGRETVAEPLDRRERVLQRQPAVSDRRKPLSDLVSARDQSTRLASGHRPNGQIGWPGRAAGQPADDRAEESSRRRLTASRALQDTTQNREQNMLADLDLHRPGLAQRVDVILAELIFPRCCGTPASCTPSARGVTRRHHPDGVAGGESA